MKILVTYRATSRLSMRIDRKGQVRVSAPFGLSRDAVTAFINGHRDWIVEALQSTAQRNLRRQAFFDQLPLSTRAQRKEQTERLDAKIRPLIEKYAAMLGRCPSHVGYGATKTRWGSCQIKTRRIRFSLYLLLLSDFCIEHVVAHEMCHLFVPNHGAEFYALMDCCFPQWREARREPHRLCRLGER